MATIQMKPRHDVISALSPVDVTRTMARTKQMMIHKRKVATGDNPTKKKRRWRPGTQAKREIKHYQNTVHTLIPQEPFKRCVKDIVETHCRENPYLGSVRISKNAYRVLQEAAEAHITELFQFAKTQCLHRKAETVSPDDIRQATGIQATVCATQSS